MSHHQPYQCPCLKCRDEERRIRVIAAEHTILSNARLPWWWTIEQRQIAKDAITRIDFQWPFSQRVALIERLEEIVTSARSAPHRRTDADAILRDLMATQIARFESFADMCAEDMVRFEAQKRSLEQALEKVAGSKAEPATVH